MFFRRREKTASPDTPPARVYLPEIEDQETLDTVLASEQAILYKHSTRCVVSSWSFRQVRNFAADHPEWPVYVLKVIEERALSNQVSDRLGIQHQSPQAFVIRNGEVVWDGSHNDVSADALVREIQA